MAKRLFLDEGQLREVGFDPRMVATFRKLAEFVDTQTRLAEAEATAAALDATVVALDGTVATAEAAIVALDGRIDAYDALAPFVEQDVGPAWTAASGTASRATYATYAAPAITNPPTQAEVQAIADAVQILSQRVKALIDDLTANSALSS